ncbi:MAG: hypothetical protein K9W46_12605 [Candidatus Heimdallarchaeum endolithica]|uniref:Uncharacterized protein n=1 Tax=Candidatus Heimdallarchaeum endolithica TaxID=2876572 RepID=A0A9Y1FNR9_9ARCH|nr:MAG: hypothetical protein K9W46_12605 [Candidatus Heimdallarchaeum endolithica]
MIKHLLILTTYGQIFYSQEFGTEETVDVALTGGLMSAIYSMATETQRENITEFEMMTSRIKFREEENDLLFVLTVDKRMDEKDVEDLLDMISKRFFEKYGELRVDGLILSDFEEDVTEIINNKLWYLETSKRKFKFFDYLALIVTSVILGWYIYLIFNIPSFVWTPLLKKLAQPVDFVLYLLILMASFSLPGLALYFILKFSNIKDIFRFSKDYLTRPTRASYAELLPNYFLLSIVISYVLYFSFMVFSKAYFSEITAFPMYPGALLGSDYSQPFSFYNMSSSDIGDQVLVGSFTWFSWVFLCPLIYSLILGEKEKWKLLRNSIFIASIAITALLGCLVVGGVIYLQAVGFHPTNPVLFADDVSSLLYQFVARFPLNIFFYGFLLFLGVGINRVTPPKTKVSSLLAIWVSIYLTLIIQRLFSDLWAGN